MVRWFVGSHRAYRILSHITPDLTRLKVLFIAIADIVIMSASCHFPFRMVHVGSASSGLLPT